MSCEKRSGSVKRVCADAERYVARQLETGPRVAVIACEGACIKGEVARVAANVLADQLERARTSRICLGDAATADSGMRDLVTRAPRVLALEGCPLHCGTEILKRRVPELKPEIVTASALYQYDRTKYFEIFDMPSEELAGHARTVAEHVQREHFGARSAARDAVLREGAQAG